jgi:hypothetical protein
MTISRQAVFAVVTIVVGVGIWFAQMFVGLNYYGEGNEGSYPWFLRLMQWTGLALVLALVFLVWALLSRSTGRHA